MSSYIHVHLNVLRFLYFFRSQFAKGHLQLLHVLHHRFGQWCLWTFFSIVASILLFESNSIVIAISIRLKGFPLTGKTYLDISWSYLYNLHWLSIYCILWRVLYQSHLDSFCLQLHSFNAWKKIWNQSTKWQKNSKNLKNMNRGNQAFCNSLSCLLAHIRKPNSWAHNMIERIL